MPRNRVLSFMSQWGSHAQDSSSTTSPKTSSNNGRVVPVLDTAAAQSVNPRIDSGPRSPTPQSPSTPSRARGDSRTGGRPLSMIQTYQAPQVDFATDTPPELQPIFSFLNSHGNKLYQEGYFLKLHDLDARGRPSADRTWVECFAQLVGTVLSLWDAAALDAAGVDGEVMPTFINLSDASLKMIESLPMSGAQGGKLQNVLSISTAANNRYLLHFNSLNSLTQWTAGIRLAMFEHATLQEAYTGSLVAAKGRYLNSIKAIMERTRYPTEDWARVRFGAGTPWRRLWFVITPPDEKEYQKAKKMVSKGGSYLRSQLPRGDIKFYDTKKIQKKTQPIATINDVYAAYAIYPQSKPLIDQSTLVKMEGLVTIHSSPETTAEGFVFIMPEVHAAVSGFEMMLRWLFPVWDTFNLYGRPNKLIADTLDQRGLMFAMPRDRRYGYLDTLDVSGLIHETGSQTWSERQWRKQMKKLTAERMNRQLEGAPVYGHHRSATGSQSSLPNAPRGVRFNDADSTHSNQSRSASPAPGPFAPPKRVDSAPPTQRSSPHKRAASEAQNYKRYQADTPSRLSNEMSRGNEYRPMPPPHTAKPYNQQGPGTLQRIESGLATPTMGSMQAGLHPNTDATEVPPEPVSSPPAFTHNPGAKPAHSPRNMPELRRAHSAVDAATLSQMHDAATVQGAEDDYGNLVPHKVDDDYRNARKTHADLSQGSLATHSPMRTQPGQRPLSTIAASPRFPDEFESIDQRTQPQSPSRPLPAVPDDQRPPMPMSRSSQSVTRKPVPRKAVAAPQPPTPTSDHGSFTNAYIDNDALEQILQDDARLNSMGSIASSATPDYASTRSAASKQGKASMERPRMGKLKTVGDPDLLPLDKRPSKFDTYQADQQVAAAAVVPTIDFGPTYSYKPTTRPDTAKTLRQGDRSRSHSRDRLSGYLGNSNKNSPGDINRNSYFGTDANLNQPGNRHSIAWTPGAGVSPGPSSGLTPEQWVQYRAAVASQPQNAPRPSAPALSHSRQNSTHSITRKLTKTPPPFARTPSGDWSQMGRVTPPSRPDSRGAGTYLGRSSPGPQHSLSAAEQMHVARATGTPLLGMSNTPRQMQENTVPNLLDTVAMREREKAAIKDGMRTGMVEEAIRSRQQQQMQNNAEALRQQAILAQQQQQQAAQAYQFQQNAYTASASPSVMQAQRQSWIQPQAYHQQLPPQPMGTSPYENQQFSSPFAQRLYEGQQAQAFMAQQGQPNRRSPGPGYNR